MEQETLFPAVSNWSRVEPVDDKVTNAWNNYETFKNMHTRYVEGPFGTKTSIHVVEIRDLSSEEWKIHSKHDTQSEAEQAAYEYAQENNE